MKEPVWHFCESSKPLLQRCIDAASKNNNNSNEWLKHFHSIYKKNEINSESVEKMVVDEEIPVPIEDHVESKELLQENKEKDIEESSNLIFSEDINDLDPVNSFEELTGKCLRNTKTFQLLAKSLPFNSIEKLCNHIFSMEDLNIIFLEHFYKLFLPELLKRDNTHLCLDILVKAKKFNKQFDELLIIIINDIDIPKHVLLEYSSTLESKEKLELLKNMCQIITKDVFLHHMHTIHSLYKECEILEDIQRYIFQNFKQIHEYCSNDKNFGKFLLNFLQIQKKLSIYSLELTKIVDSHTSVFKKPCINVLNDIKSAHSLSQS